MNAHFSKGEAKDTVHLWKWYAGWMLGITEDPSTIVPSWATACIQAPKEFEYVTRKPHIHNYRPSEQRDDHYVDFCWYHKFVPIFPLLPDGQLALTALQKGKRALRTFVIE